MKATGHLKKMRTEYKDAQTPVDYTLILDQDIEIPLNKLIGHIVELKHTGKINCINCGRALKKTFAQGYCYPCFNSLAETDSCIVRPHECHHHLGTCRDNEFAEQHCFIPHVVYLAVSSGAKVGITRDHQKHTRWADQGAIQAMELAVVPHRKLAGEIEIELSQHISDKTNWRKMLTIEHEPIDLLAAKSTLLELILPKLEQALAYAEDSATAIEMPEVCTIDFPLAQSAPALKSLDLTKQAEYTGELLGIKGQYLIFADRVFNVRRHAGFKVEIQVR